MNNTIIVNPKLFEKTKQAIITSGAKDLHIVTDFDRTLTKAFDGEKKCHAIISQVQHGKYLTIEYPAKAQALYDKYRPIEINTKLPTEEREQKMVEWWTTHLNLLIESGMNKDAIKDIIEKRKIVLRNNTTKFFNLIEEKKIPCLILSSALGDFIENLLEFEKLPHAQIHTISNFFKFDKKGNVIGYKSRIIHSMNKSEAEIKNTPHFKKILSRKNVILLGDTIDDLQMVEGINYNNIIKICFLNKETQTNIEEYKKHFDVLILNDGPMDFVNELLEEIK